MSARKLNLIVLVGAVIVIATSAPIAVNVWERSKIRHSIGVLESSKELGARYEALDKLEEAGTEAHAAVPVLLQTLEDPDSGIRWRSAVALGSAAKGESTVIRALERGLLDADQTVRLFSISSLAHVRPLDERTADKLLPFVMDKDPELRRFAIQTLGYFTVFPAKVEAIFDAQQKLTKDKDSEVRRIACYSLGVYGSHSDRREVVDELIRMLDDSVYNVRWQAIDALGEIGSRSQSALEKLEAIAKNSEEEPEIRETAEDVMTAIRTGKEYSPKYTYKHLFRWQGVEMKP